MIAAALLAGVFFGFGLALSTMIQPAVVLTFLNLADFGLLLVMGGAMVVAMLAFQLLPRFMSRPLLGGTFRYHESEMSRATVVGAALFGIGWGLCGVCPGPSLAGLGAGSWELLYSVAGIAVGAWVQGAIAGA